LLDFQRTPQCARCARRHPALPQWSWR
jgi:hypothetical protein